MAVGRILTQGLGTFSSRRYLLTLGLGSRSPTPSDGWRSPAMSRVVVAQDDRSVRAGNGTRVVWAKPQVTQ